MKMKITVVGINYAPELTGIGPYTSDMCQSLIEKGHDVTMITGFPYYPMWEIPETHRRKIFSTEVINGVQVKRGFLYVRKNITTKQRIIHELSFLVSSFLTMLFSPRPDQFIFISPPLGLGVAAYVISLLKMRPFHYHIQDLQPDAAVSLGMLKDGSFTKFLFQVEKFIYKKAHSISTITRSMKDRIRSKGISGNKIYILPNWSNFNKHAFKCSGDEFRRKHNLEDKFIFLYSGNIGQKQGLDDLIEAASGIKNGRIVFLIVGTGAYVQQLQKKADNLKVNNVMFLPLQPKEKLPEMLAAADVCLVIQKRVVSDLVFPSKMTNIMAAGKPALVTADEQTELAQTVLQADCGFVAKPEDSEDLKKNIQKAFADITLKQKGENARRYAEQYLEREAVLGRFNKFISSENHDRKSLQPQNIFQKARKIKSRLSLMILASFQQKN